MSSDPIRAALERLVEALNDYDPKWDAFPEDAITAARAALAAAQEGEGPSAEQVEDLCEEHCFNVEGYESIECLQGLINDALARWNRPATPPAPLQGEANVGSEIWAEAVANSDSDDECRSFQMGAKWALSRWARPAATPAPLEGEVGELVAWLRERVHECLQAPWTPGIKHFGRAATLLEQLSAAVPAVVPVPVSEALIKAECALADVAEGEQWCDEGDLLQWAERRCAKALASIRPVMKQHQIRTSEWPSVQAPQGGEVKA